MLKKQQDSRFLQLQLPKASIMDDVSENSFPTIFLSPSYLKQ
jgi:hypothetical protein